MRLIARTVALSALAACAATPAWAYIGPGAGLSLLGAFGALLVAILAAVGFLVLWPLRRMRRQKARQKASLRQVETDAPASDSPARGTSTQAASPTHERELGDRVH